MVRTTLVLWSLHPCERRRIGETRSYGHSLTTSMPWAGVASMAYAGRRVFPYPQGVLAFLVVCALDPLRDRCCVWFAPKILPLR
jgi:hypothetical protein